MPPVGFEPTISAGERPQTYALDRAATGTGFIETWIFEKHSIIKFHEILSIESRIVPCLSQFFERA